jgi:hypothetical protein
MWTSDLDYEPVDRETYIRPTLADQLVTTDPDFDKITDELFIGDWSFAMAVNHLLWRGDLENVATINSAAELDGDGAMFDIIVPHGAVSTEELNANAARINEIRESGSKLAINCAMGMERSVLNAVWWLHRYRDFETPEKALKFIQSKRKKAQDRLDWIDRVSPRKFRELTDAEGAEQTGMSFGEASDT